MVFVLLFTSIAIHIQRKEYEHKKISGYTFVIGDLKCTTQNVIKLPILACCIGFVTALTGIGPGAMTNAILLKLDLHPRIAAETGSLLGVYIAFGATICMLVYG